MERNEYWQSQEFETRRVTALRHKALTPEGHAYFAERGTRNLLRYMAQRPDHFRAAVAGNGKRGAKVLAGYNTSARGRAKSRELANSMYPCEECGEMVKSYIGLHNHRRSRHGRNHKVIAVETISVRAEMYCLSVSAGDNFAVSAGVFVRANPHKGTPG